MFPEAISKALRNASILHRDCTVDVSDGKLSISARSQKELEGAIRFFDLSVDGATTKIPNGEKEIDVPILFRWNNIRATSDGFTVSASICVDIYKSGVTLKDNKLHYAKEYGYRAFPLTVRYEGA